MILAGGPMVYLEVMVAYYFLEEGKEDNDSGYTKVGE